MFRNVLAAALRHLQRSRLQAAIAVLSLAIGLCGALLAALFIRSQYSHDHFVPGYRDVYLAKLTLNIPGRSPLHVEDTPAQIAGLMKERISEIRTVTRLAKEKVWLQTNGAQHERMIYSVDPNLISTLPFVEVAGAPSTELALPDRLVITREDARKLFGEGLAVGRTLEVQLEDGSRHTVTVGAVIEDIPPYRTQLQARVFISGLTAWTRLGVLDRRTEPPQGLSWEVRTLMRLNSGASPERMRLQLADVLRDAIPAQMSAAVGPNGHRLDVVRVDHVNSDVDLNPAFRGRILMSIVLALVIMAIAIVNFISLVTARTSTRALEAGIRKLAGARRSTLALQFFGEVFAQVVIATVIALAMAELLLPHFNAFLEVDASLQYWKEPALLGWTLMAVLLLGLLSGLWPAVALSALRPLQALRGAQLARGGGGFLRLTSLTLQFALLTALVLATGVVYFQRHFATEEALRFDTDHVLILNTDCTPARMTELRRLEGVRDVACSDAVLLGGFTTFQARTRDGQRVPMHLSQIDDRVLGMYGISPIAGRALTTGDYDDHRASRSFLINETAMRNLGIASPAAALGPYPVGQGLQEIVGVVPDFSMGPVDQRIQPMAFQADPRSFSRIHIKLKTGNIVSTLDAIDRTWKTTGGIGSLDRYFYKERVQRMYRSMQREGFAFSVVSLVAIVLACLGLFGLAVTVTERRTREIGIRKALGATTADVLRLLLWHFTKPVALASLLAWPVAGYLMQRWLAGFAYHVDLPLWLFPVTTLAVLLIALATVATQSLAVTRSKPAGALRHE